MAPAPRRRLLLSPEHLQELDSPLPLKFLSSGQLLAYDAGPVTKGESNFQLSSLLSTASLVMVIINALKRFYYSYYYFIMWICVQGWDRMLCIHECKVPSKARRENWIPMC